MFISWSVPTYRGFSSSMKSVTAIHPSYPFCNAFWKDIIYALKSSSRKMVSTVVRQNGASLRCGASIAKLWRSADFKGNVPIGVCGNKCVYKGFCFGVKTVNDYDDFFSLNLVEDAYESSNHGLTVKFNEWFGACQPFLCQTATFTSGNYRVFHNLFKCGKNIWIKSCASTLFTALQRGSAFFLLQVSRAVCCDVAGGLHALCHGMRGDGLCRQL